VEIGGKSFFEQKKNQLQGTLEGYGATLQRLEFFSNGKAFSTQKQFPKLQYILEMSYNG